MSLPGAGSDLRSVSVLKKIVVNGMKVTSFDANEKENLLESIEFVRGKGSVEAEGTATDEPAQSFLNFFDTILVFFELFPQLFPARKLIRNGPVCDIIL